MDDLDTVNTHELIEARTIAAGVDRELEALACARGDKDMTLPHPFLAALAEVGQLIGHHLIDTEVNDDWRHIAERGRAVDSSIDRPEAHGIRIADHEVVDVGIERFLIAVCRVVQATKHTAVRR